MRDQNVIRVEGTVKEILSDRLYRVELANGHRFIGFLPAREAETGARFSVADRVTVEMSPLDLSKGRIKAKL